MALYHQRVGDYNNALAQYRILLEENEASAEVHNNLAVAFLRDRQLDDAAAELKVALAIDARNIESLVNLALVQKAAGRTAEARDLLRRSVSFDPRHARSHSTSPSLPTLETD